MLKKEFDNRNYKFNFSKNFITKNVYYGEDTPFPKHHNNKYLQQCFYNLQEKYDRGQKDFSEFLYVDLLTFISKERIENEGSWRIIY